MTSENTPAERPAWSGKLAFVLAGAASAVGLGNLWRFPYLAAQYGGGTFLFVYFCLAFTVGISLLLVETSLGRHTRKSPIKAFSFFGKNFGFIGVLASVVPLIITPYYCVIGGWVTKYMTAYLTSGPAALADGGTYFADFISSPVASLVFMLVFIALTFITIAAGVQKGIEKANLVLMPALIVMAAAIAVFTLTMPGAVEGAAYYLTPDLSKLSPELFINALGQMFYSMSIAMGIMVTYGSYMRKQDSLPSSCAQIACFDFGVSFLAGLMIVPAAFVAMGSASAVAENSGPSLMFIILPQVFNTMSPVVATVVGCAFFLLVLFAALTSSISLGEAVVSIVADGTGCTRTQAIIVTTIYTVVIGVLVNGGYSFLSGVQPMGEGTTILDFMDFISNSVIMPIVAICTCVFVGWVIKPKVLIAEIKESSRFALEKPWVVVVKFLAPIFMVLILVFNILPYITG